MDTIKNYVIQSGDTFFLLARQNGCCWQDFVKANPGVDPCALYVGQIITIPSKAINGKNPAALGPSGTAPGCSGYSAGGKGVNRCDEVILDVEGVKIRVTRAGEPATPHELHFILPRTEIRKVECPGTGVIETDIMLSNINIVNSPRFEGEKTSLGIIYDQQAKSSDAAMNQTDYGMQSP